MIPRKALIAIGFILAVLLLALITVSNYILQSAVASGRSMEPTIMHGDHILIDRRAYRSHGPGIGDIIAFRSRWKVVIKRVVGVPGDLIELKFSSLYRNGEVLFNNCSKKRFYIKTRVGDRHVFVVGDNIQHSFDSRDIGTVAYDEIIGKVIAIFYPPRRARKL